MGNGPIGHPAGSFGGTFSAYWDDKYPSQSRRQRLGLPHEPLITGTERVKDYDGRSCQVGAGWEKRNDGHHIHFVRRDA